MKNPIQRLARLRIHIALIAMFAALISGCDTTKPYLKHPEFTQRAATLGKPVALSPNITINKVTTGGIKEPDEEKTSETTQRFVTAISSQKLNSSGEEISFPQVPEDIYDELEDALTLSQTVSTTIMYYLFNPLEKGFFEHKREDFRYSIGDCSAILDALGGDTLLIVNGYEQFAGAGRATLNVISSILMTAASQSSVVYGDGAAYASAMLVDRNGDVLWFSYRDSVWEGGGFTIRSEKAPGEIVQSFVQDYREPASDS